MGTRPLERARGMTCQNNTTLNPTTLDEAWKGESWQKGDL